MGLLWCKIKKKYLRYLYFELKAGAHNNLKQTVTRAKSVEKARKKFKDKVSRKNRLVSSSGSS